MKIKFLGGLLALVAIAAIVVIVIDIINQKPVITVTGYAGASKEAFLKDPQVKQILHDKHHLDVTFKVSSEVCGLPPGDFLWPGAQFAVEEYEDCKNIPKADADSVFTSPLVFYSWDQVIGVLIRENLVAENKGIYYANDLPRLFELFDDPDKEWKDIGVPIVGNVAVIPAEPKTADSGLLFGAMMSNIKLDGVATMETLPRVVPEVVDYYKRLGLLEESTDDLFRGYLARGLGTFPVIVAYESFLPSLIHEKDLTCAKAQELRVIYPEPTVWASHPMIAETPSGRLLIGALRKDAEIQKIAWERYGFRTFLGDSTQTSPTCLKMPSQILQVRGLPDFKTMDFLYEKLKNR